MPRTFPIRLAHPPAFWSWLLQRYLHAPKALARRLWRIFEEGCPYEVLRQIAQVSGEDAVPDDVDRFCALVQPSDLLDALEELCPPGQRRRREVIQLGQAILAVTNKDGRWATVDEVSP